MENTSGTALCLILLSKSPFPKTKGSWRTASLSGADTRKHPFLTQGHTSTAPPVHLGYAAITHFPAFCVTHHHSTGQ